MNVGCIISNFAPEFIKDNRCEDRKMKNKLKLIALMYSSADQVAMTDWQSQYGSQFEIVEWSNPLTVPIQSAVAHYCDSDRVSAPESNCGNVDGLLIDSHHSYDPIVMRQLDDLLKPLSMLLMSTSNGANPVIGEITPQVMTIAEDLSNVFTIIATDSSSQSQPQRTKLAV